MIALQSHGSYTNLSVKELEERASQAYELYRKCRVCPHHCEINRTQGEVGICQLTDELKVTAFVQHFGEEPIFTQTRGVGNIFVTSCNMRCVYCQNYQASQIRLGSDYSYEEVAEQMLKLQQTGVHFIGWVTPSHVVPGLLKSLSLARKKGLYLPIIYNTSSFDDLDTLKILDGIVDIYLPDLKYSDADIAKTYSRIKNYVEISRAAVAEMYRQVGPLRTEESESIQRGLLIRHLVLPNSLAGTWETLCFIALELSPKIPISLMGQYHPVHDASHFSELNRFITIEEYESAVQMAKDLGFENIFTQELDVSKHNMPNFEHQEAPFIF